MKTFVLSACFLVSAGLAVADEKTRAAQTELKEQGFYYGESDGNFGSETSAAIKRFQIRNGLEVTGTLTQQTLEALGLAESTDTAPRAVTPPAAPRPPTAAPQETRPPPVHLRRESTVEERDQNFLRGQEDPRTFSSDDPSIVSPPTPLPPPVGSEASGYAELFDKTPYESAPLELQQSTVRRVQGLLARDGSYREPIDGVPGPATEEAILSYQRRARLPLTGRLDLETLNRMRLLPGRGGPPVQPFYEAPRSRQASPSRAFRGIWVE